MPSGFVHDTINLIFIIFASLLYFFIPYNYYPFFLLGFMFSTFLLSPDLDLSYSKISKRWGILKIFLYPYFFLSTHRGMSHTFILGTLVRYTYLILLCIFFLEIYTYFNKKNFDLKILNIFQSYILLYKNYIIFFLLGSIVADTIHIILDKICSYEKKNYVRKLNVKNYKKF